MKRKLIWLVVSYLMVAALVLASCGLAVTEEGEVVAPTEEEEEVVTPPEEEEEVVAPEKEMVKVTLTKLDGTVVEKMVEKPKYGGTITAADTSDPNSFDPYDMQGSTNRVFAPFVYEKMQMGDWTRGPAGTNEYSFTNNLYRPMEFRIGHLAESWEQPDAQTLIWHIRPGIRYQNIPPVNGREMTAEDVAYSINRQRVSPFASLKYHGTVESAEATDKYTVVVKLKWPDYTYVDIVGDGHANSVYAREMVEKYGNLNEWKSACGTGPWILESYVRGNAITYKRNPDYWKKDPFFPENTLPYADRLKVLIIPDLSTRVSALRTGKLDFITGHAYWQDAEALKKTNPEIKQLAFVPMGGLISIQFRVDKPPFDDIRVRQAMALAIDQNAIVKDYLKGNGELHNLPIMREWGEAVYTPMEKLPTEPRLPGSRCSVRELYEYKPEKAKRLLAEAGYPEGFKTDVFCVATEVDITSLVAAYWEDIGVDLEIKVVDRAVKAKITAAMPRTYDADMCVQFWVACDRYGDLVGQWVTDAFRNVGNISDPFVDQAHLDLVSEPDLAKRDKMGKDLTLYLLEQAYKLGGPNAYNYTLWQPWLKNCEGTSYLAKWGWAPGCMHYWVDQDLKEEMTGRR